MRHAEDVHRAAFVLYHSVVFSVIIEQFLWGGSVMLVPFEGGLVFCAIGNEQGTHKARVHMGSYA